MVTNVTACSDADVFYSMLADIAACSNMAADAADC
jgi:hypothetical protein